MPENPLTLPPLSKDQLLNAVNMYTTIEKAENILKSFKKDKNTELAENGKVIDPGQECPICKGHMDYPTESGFCSKKCESEFKMAKVTGAICGLKDKAENVFQSISDAVEYMNSLLDIAVGIPAMIIDVNAIPIEAYSAYYMNKIYILELQIKQKINEVLVYKNKLLIKMLKQNRDGISSAADTVVGGALTSINAIVDGINVALQAFDVAYTAVYNTLVNAMVPFLLKPESMSFFFTPRSLTKKPGIFVIPMSIINLNVSAVDVLNADTIESVIDIGFPKIQDWEYCMDPQAFKVRQMFSDQNAKGIYDLISLMEVLFYTGSEPLPKYSKLKLSNPWYLIFLLTGWGPASQICFGIPGTF